MCKNINNVSSCGQLWFETVWNIKKPYFKTFVFKYVVYAVLNERNSVCFHPTARTLCFVVINRRKQSGKQNQFDQPLDVFIAMTLPNISLKLFSTLMYMLSSIVCVCVCFLLTEVLLCVIPQLSQINTGFSLCLWTPPNYHNRLQHCICLVTKKDSVHLVELKYLMLINDSYHLTSSIFVMKNKIL